MTDTGILLLTVAAFCACVGAIHPLAERYVRWRDRNAADKPLSDEWKVPK